MPFVFTYVPGAYSKQYGIQKYNPYAFVNVIEGVMALTKTQG